MWLTGRQIEGEVAEGPPVVNAVTFISLVR
jgi:hypothetical protein